MTKLLWLAALCWVIPVSASAVTLIAPLKPDHDWTVCGCGLQGYNSTTVLLVRPDYLDIPLPILVVAASALLAVAYPCVVVLHSVLKST